MKIDWAKNMSTICNGRLTQENPINKNMPEKRKPKKEKHLILFQRKLEVTALKIASFTRIITHQ